MESDPRIAFLLELIRAVELATCLSVAVVLLRRLRRQPSQATGSAFGLFLVVALVLVSGYLPEADGTSGVRALWDDLLISALLTVPYLLVRFARVLLAIGRRAHVACAVLLAAELVATFAAPPLGEEGAPKPDWALAYITFVLGAWAVQSVVAAVGLWRAGRGQSSMVRHRMRSLGWGAVLLAITLVLSSALPGHTGEVGVAMLGLVSILLFALAFLVPASLRLVWRQDDMARLAIAERGLMTALTPAEVAETIVPAVTAIFGGGGAALLDEDGVAVLATGRLSQAGPKLPSDAPVNEVRQVEHGVLAARLTRGWLVVRAGDLAPIFGDDETVLLSRVALLVDLALERVKLFDEERVSRLTAESANAELETLLYSVSHDLRSPLISVMGYLEVLNQEHADALPPEGRHYVGRIAVNAQYMQCLISDLLELSRIGRAEPAPVVLDLREVIAQLAESVRLSLPAATVTAEGALPLLLLSDVRARQLLTNLVDNAVKHSGRPDVQVRVSSAALPGGAVAIQVSDNGRGIPEAYREKVLRVFERLDTPTSSTGTGMGLAICKRIAESVGGTLTVAGPPEGSPTGTTISLQLPATVVLNGRVPTPRAPSSGPAVRAGIKETS